MHRLLATVFSLYKTATLINPWKYTCHSKRRASWLKDLGTSLERAPVEAQVWSLEVCTHESLLRSELPYAKSLVDP